MKRAILIIWCVFLFTCAALIEPSPFGALGAQTFAAQRIAIDKEFAKRLIDTALAANTEEDQFQFLIRNLNSLDAEQLTQLAAIIKADRDSGAGEILPLDYAMPWRVAGWICNYIDDRFGRLRYDLAVDGYIGLVDSASTVRFYWFKPESGPNLIVAIGVSTVHEYNGAIVSWHDWECYSGRVRLLLRRDKELGPHHYSALKISPFNEEPPAAAIWPQCNK